MHTYVSTFITGFESLIPDLLVRELPDAEVQSLSNGVCSFSTNAVYRKVRDLPFMTNTFIVLSQTEIQSEEEKRDPVKSVKELAELAQVSSLLSRIPRTEERSFRVRVSSQGDLIGIPKKIQHRIESEIASRTGFKLDPLRSDLEFWFLIRREGVAFYAVKEVFSHIKREKGVLSFDLSYILCSLASPTSQDTILDPFAGSGRIPFTLLKHFPHKHIIASDYDTVNVRRMNQTARKLKKKDSSFDIINIDALQLSRIPDVSVDTIITDPPWGIYKKTNINIKKFYRMMLEEMIRVTKKNGILIILTSQKELFEETLGYFDAITIEKTYHILVSGKKAGVYKVRKGD